MLTPEQVREIRKVERKAAELGQYEAAEGIRLLDADRANIAQELGRIREALWDGRHGQDHLTPCEIDDTFITLIERIKA